jgi:hypothetical protein
MKQNEERCDSMNCPAALRRAVHHPKASRRFENAEPSTKRPRFSNREVGFCLFAMLQLFSEFLISFNVTVGGIRDLEWCGKDMRSTAVGERSRFRTSFSVKRELAAVQEVFAQNR